MRTILRVALFALGGLVYGCALLISGFAASGAGEGANGPMMVSFSPISLIIGPLHDRYGVRAENILCPSMPFLWMLAGGLLGRISNRKCRWALILVLLSHYISAAACVMFGDVEWRSGSGLHTAEVMGAVLIATAIYLAGQIAIWWILLRSFSRHSASASPAPPD